MAQRHRISPAYGERDGRSISPRLVARTAGAATVTPETEQFLRANPGLRSLIEEAARELDRYFPDESLHASLHRPDVDGGPAEIILSVVTDLPWDEAIDRLEHFDEEWWLDRVHDADGMITITFKRA